MLDVSWSGCDTCHWLSGKATLGDDGILEAYHSLKSGMGLLAFTYGLHERFAGMAAAALRDWSAAERHFERTLTLAQELPHRVDQARVRYWYARMLLERNESGDCDRANQLLSEAHTLS